MQTVIENELKSELETLLENLQWEKNPRSYMSEKFNELTGSLNEEDLDFWIFSSLDPEDFEIECDTYVQSDYFKKEKIFFLFQMGGEIQLSNGEYHLINNLIAFPSEKKIEQLVCDFVEHEVENFCSDFLELAISDRHGIYIPETFQSHYGQENIDDDNWKELASPDSEFYWEAWESVLDGWESEGWRLIQGEGGLWTYSQAELEKLPEEIQKGFWERMGLGI